MDWSENRSNSIKIIDGLPIVSTSVTYNSKSIRINNALLDTGSGGTIFSADRLLEIGVALTLDDELIRISGVGGTELAFSKKIDRLSLGDLEVEDFSIEVGAMNYSVDIDGIIGMDFLLRTGALINLDKLHLGANNISI